MSEIARLHRKAAGASLMQHDTDQAEPHLLAAEAMAPGSAERARLACLRANQSLERGEVTAARSFAKKGLRLAQRDGDIDEIAAAHETLAVVFHYLGEWREGLRVEIERLGDSADENAQLARVFDIHHCIGQYHLYGDGLSTGVEGYARHTLELAEKAGAVRAQAFAWCLLGESLLLQARWEESAGCLERSCELHGSLGARSGALPWQRLAELMVCSGAPEKAEDYLRRASAIATVSPMAKHLWGRIHATAALAALEQGDPSSAVRSVRAAGGAAVRHGDCPSCSALLNPVAAEAFAALGDPEGARPHVEAAGRVAAMFDSSAWRAMAESTDGSLAVSKGQAWRAQERFEAAAALYERAGQPYWAERSLVMSAGT
jgi:tetratricopeptide (TPR) repeat protein